MMKKMAIQRISYWIPGVALIALLSAGCRKDYVYTPPPVTQFVDTFSFTNHVIPVFNGGCNTIPNTCHAGTTPPKNLNLSSANAYSSLFATGQIDTVTNKTTPEANNLYAKISTGTMKGYLPKPADATLILNWLKGGAKNN